MANALVQFRTDETERTKAAAICAALGMDLPTYLRMCVSRLVRERGIPFHMHLDDAPMMRGIRAMQHASMIAHEEGIAADRPHLWEDLDDLLRNRAQAVEAEHKRIPVEEEDAFHRTVVPPLFTQIVLDLLHRLHRERHVAVHRAIAASLVAAPLRHLHEQRIRLIRRPISYPCVFHRPLPIFTIMLYL